MLTAVLNRQGSSHGIFIPFISGYFIWSKRATLRTIPFRFDKIGIPLLILSVALGFLKVDGYHVKTLSFLLMVLSLVIVFFGRHLFLKISFPLFFLVTMIPIPINVYKALADFVRLITFGASSWLISIFRIPFFREGFLIHIPGATLQVAESCSGIRYLISYFVFSMAYAYFFRRTFFHRICVVSFSIFLSLAASIFRLVSIVMATYIFGPKMSEHWPHIFISWSVFITFLFLCISIDQHYFVKNTKISSN